MGPFAAASTTSSKDSAASRLIGMLRMLWGKVTAVDESSSPSLRKALNLVWENMGDLSAVKLSRVTHRPNSAWSQAVAGHKTFISNRAMAGDHTFDNLLGM